MNQTRIVSVIVWQLFWTFQVSSSHFQSSRRIIPHPSAAWSPTTVELYKELMEKTVDGSWMWLSGCWLSVQFLKEADLARIAKAVPGKFETLCQEHLTWAGGGFWIMQNCWKTLLIVWAFSSKMFCAPEHLPPLWCGFHQPESQVKALHIYLTLVLILSCFRGPFLYSFNNYSWSTYHTGIRVRNYSKKRGSTKHWDHSIMQVLQRHRLSGNRYMVTFQLEFQCLDIQNEEFVFCY